MWKEYITTEQNFEELDKALVDCKETLLKINRELDKVLAEL